MEPTTAVPSEPSPHPSPTPSPSPSPEAAPTGAPGRRAAPRAGRGWVGVLLVSVLIALLVGMNVVLLVRVQRAQDAADRAAAVAATQTEVLGRLEEVDRQLSSVSTSQGDTAERVTTLRRCVNDAIDGIAKAVASGKAGTVTKC